MTISKALQSKCIKRTKRKLVSVRDVKTRLTFVNKKQDELIRVKIDGCLVTDNTNKRCDFMVQHKDINYYVELKGKRHYKEAYSQLASSIEMFNKYFSNKRCQPIIVVRKKKMPAIIQSELVKSGLNEHIVAGFCERPQMYESHKCYPLS